MSRRNTGTDRVDMTIMRNLFMPNNLTTQTTARPATVPDVHLLDCSTTGSSDACRRNAVIDDRVIISADDVIHHRSVTEHRTGLMVRHAIAVVAMAAEIVVGHEREAIPRQAKRKARAA